MDANRFYQHPRIRGHPSTPPIFSRDFAYSNNGPIVLASGMRRRTVGSSIKNISASTFAQLLSGPLVDIYVGSDRRLWSLHRNLLCYHSSYFETEFQGHEVPKTEAKANKLELPDANAHGFELLVKWLYQGTLDGVDEIATDEQKYEHAVACHQLHQLCEKFDMIALSNLAIDQYRANLHSAQLVPDAEEMNDIYRSSPPGSPYRRLMTKIAARQIMDPAVDKDAESYRVCFEKNTEFAIEMVNQIRTMSGGMLFDDPTRPGNECAWHDHRDGSSCKVANVQRQPPKIASPRKPKPRQETSTATIAELSERPTPRKLDTSSRKTPAKQRPSALNVTSRGLYGVDGAPPTPTSTKTAKSQPPLVTKPPRKIPATPAKPAQVNGTSAQTTNNASANANEGRKLTNTPRKPSDDFTSQSSIESRLSRISNRSSNSVTMNGTVSTRRTHSTTSSQGRLANGTNSPRKTTAPVKGARFPIKLANGTTNEATSTLSGSKYRTAGAGQVNGIVKHLDGTNGTSDEAATGHAAATQQPTSKRKFSG